VRKGGGVPGQVDDSLARRQVQLQLEAEQIAADLDLPLVLSEMGEPVRVGSAALGLMVHRDLDGTVVRPGLPVAGVARIGATLAVHRWVRQVLFRNDTGPWNVDPRYPDGLYLGLLYRSVAGKDWTIDVWFVSEPDRQPDLAHLRTLPPRLIPDARAAILRIKGRLVHPPGIRQQYPRRRHLYGGVGGQRTDHRPVRRMGEAPRHRRSGVPERPLT
jgi:hypothetical protein